MHGCWVEVAISHNMQNFNFKQTRTLSKMVPLYAKRMEANGTVSKIDWPKLLANEITAKYNLMQLSRLILLI